MKLRELLGQNVFGTRLVPVTLKIILTFSLIILVSNLTSNYVNLIFNRAALVDLMRQLLVKDLRDLNAFCNNQRQIFDFNADEAASRSGIEKKGRTLLSNRRALVLGVRPDGSLFFRTAGDDRPPASFPDGAALSTMKKAVENGVGEGYLPFRIDGADFFGVYKYNKAWDVFIVRAEEENEFYSEQRRIFRNVSVIILVITIASALVGIYLLRHILRFIGVITRSIMEMIDNQSLEIINLARAPNDDITYLGMAFNSLSSTIDNLVGIFKKFTNKDIVVKAYRDRQVRLEGVSAELTVLFSDIKSFTFITETLGMDIIKLLNMHYDRSIREIQEHDGIVSAIIGDALLAIFGVLDDQEKLHGNKSYQSILASYKIQDVARSLRREMQAKKEDIVRQRGQLTPTELKVFRAVLLEVGVGIDGGDVFYGTIGSYVRMTNTVIGDNVNSAARLEGLTRIYRMPVICSEFVKNDVERSVGTDRIYFLELDTVQVKGKTTGKRIYIPIPVESVTDRVRRESELYRRGLELYYAGDWPGAYEQFRACRLKAARVFRTRTRGNQAPSGWSGIWEMKEK